MGSSCFILVPLMYSVLLQTYGHGAAAALHPHEPTCGFSSLPLNISNFDVQRPYDLPLDDRYSFADGIHKLWVLSTDKPHSLASKTSPRTEIRIRGYDYSSGVWQFEGHVNVPSGTSGVCVMQVFGATGHATTLMLLVFDGALMYYRTQLLADDIYDKWLRINVIHDVGARLVTVFVDGVQKLVVKDREGRSHFFKCGVYSQKMNYSSFFMESRWKGIKVLKKVDS